MFHHRSSMNTTKIFLTLNNVLFMEKGSSAGLEKYYLIECKNFLVSSLCEGNILLILRSGNLSELAVSPYFIFPLNR